MSLDRLIAFGIGIVVLSAAVPWLAPGVIDGWPSADTVGVEDAQGASAPADAPDKSKRVPGYSHQVALSADPSGHYLADATVDGVAIRVIVDTGATMVALTAETAKRLAIDASRTTGHVGVSTANGEVYVGLVKLNHIRLGSVDVYDVEAAVMPPGTLSINLLGMSFLGKLSRFQAGGGQLVLVQ